jgi:hypothetical protein
MTETLRRYKKQTGADTHFFAAGRDALIAKPAARGQEKRRL